MSSNRISPNQREAIKARDSITGLVVYPTATNNKLDVNATATLSGSSIPITSATTAVAVGIVDGSGNQITSFGGGTQYTDGGATPTHPTGTMPVFNNAGTISQVSNSVGLPVNIVAGGGTGGGPADVSASSAASESDVARQKVTSALRLYDTGQAAGSQLVTAKGDQTSGMWVNVKAGTVTTSPPSNASTNVTQWAGTAVTLNKGSSDAGTLRVTLGDGTQAIGSITNTAFTANAGTNLNTSALALDTSVNGLLLAQASTTSGQKGPLVQGAVTTNAPSYTTAQTNALSLDTSGLLRVSLKDTPSNTNNINVALAASSATVTVSGTVTTTPPSNASTNVTQFGGVNVSTGTGAGGTGIPRVTVSNDSAIKVWDGTTVAGVIAGTTALKTDLSSVAGTATTTAASGTQLVGIADGAGNKLTTNSTTFTAKFGLDANLLGTLGTAFSTAGKVDVKGADGDVFVRQATAANLNATVVGQATGSAVPSTAFYNGYDAQTSLPSAATPGNLTGGMSDKFGRQVTLNNAFRDILGTQTTTISAGTETTIITQAASTFNDLVSIFASNTSATAIRVDIRDTTAGSVIFQLYVPAGDMRGVSLSTPWPQTTVNTNWTATLSSAVTDVRISALFIKNK